MLGARERTHRCLRARSDKGFSDLRLQICRLAKGVFEAWHGHPISFVPFRDPAPTACRPEWDHERRRWSRKYLGVGRAMVGNRAPVVQSFLLGARRGPSSACIVAPVRDGPLAEVPPILEGVPEPAGGPCAGSRSPDTIMREGIAAARAAACAAAEWLITARSSASASAGEAARAAASAATAKPAPKRGRISTGKERRAEVGAETGTASPAMLPFKRTRR